MEEEGRPSRSSSSKDATVNAEAFGYTAKTLPGGYQRTPLEELIRWRLFERTGGGLMVELGSHQLDAASIFITAQRPDGKKVQPLTVVGVGGRSLFPADREVDDHVYCTFEFPGTGYYKDAANKRSCRSEQEDRRHVLVDQRQRLRRLRRNRVRHRGHVDPRPRAGCDALQRLEHVDQDQRQARRQGPAMDTYETGGGATQPLAQAATPANVSRGYTEEIEHWAWCIRNPAPEHQPHCRPEIALGDAVIALTSNIAIAKRERIEFKPEWFDINSDETPEGTKPRPATEITLIRRWQIVGFSRTVA